MSSPAISHLPSCSLQDLIDAFNGDDPESPEWQAAVLVAVRESKRLLLRAGPLNDTGGDLSDAICVVAEEALDYKSCDRAFYEVLEKLPKEQVMEIEPLGNTREVVKATAAYVLGLAVGMRMAGGPR